MLESSFSPTSKTASTENITPQNGALQNDALQNSVMPAIPFVMSWQLVLAAIPFALLVAVLAFLNLRQGTATYHTLTTGFSIFNQGVKKADFGFIIGLIGGFCVALLLLSLVAYAVKRRHGTATLEQFYDFLLYANLPFVFFVLQLFLHKIENLSPINYSMIFTGMVVVFSLLSLRLPMPRVRFRAVVGSSCVAVTLGTFAGLAIMLFINRIAPNFPNPFHPTLPWVNYADAKAFGHYSFWISLTLVLLVWFGVGRRWWSLETRLHHMMFLMQLSLPLLYVIMLPIAWQYPWIRSFTYSVQPRLILLVGALILFGYIGIFWQWYRYRRAQREHPEQARGVEVIDTLNSDAYQAQNEVSTAKHRLSDPLTSLSVWAMGGLLMFIKFSAYFMPYISHDDYHFGEWILPWWLWQGEGMGALPFVDYVPPHGFINYVPGFAASLFTEMTAAGYGMGLVYAAALLFLLCFILLSRFLGILPVFVLFLFIVTDNASGLLRFDSLLLFTLVFCTLGTAWLRRRPNLWLLAWGIFSLGFVFYLTGQGALFVLATLPLGLWMLARAVRQSPRGFMGLLLSVVAVGFLLWKTTPIFPMLLGVITYGLENSSVYEAAYATHWAVRFGLERPLNRWLWETFRLSWIFVALTALVLSFGVWIRLLKVRSLQKNQENSDEKTVSDATSLAALNDNLQGALFVILPMALILLLMVSYVMNRLDIGFSRAETIGVWSLGILLPLMFRRLYPQQATKALVVSLLLVATFSSSNFAKSTRASGLLTRAGEFIIPKDENFVDGNALGMPNLGTAIMTKKNAARLIKLKPVLDYMLEPGETYLDMTNRNAQYFYLGYPPPIESGALYNLPNEAQQIRAAKALLADPPPIILADGDAIFHDGGSNALRAHLVYRFAVLNYIPYARDGYTYLVRPDRYHRLVNYYEEKERQLFGEVMQPRQTLEDALATLDKTFRPKGLQHLPITWANTYDGLQDALLPALDLETEAVFKIRNDDVAYLEPNYYQVKKTGKDPGVVYYMQHLNLPAKDAGILSFDYTCEGPAPENVKPWQDEEALILESNRIAGENTELQIFFSGGSFPEPADDMVIKMSPRNGRVMLPLDAYPDWLLFDHLIQLRFDLAAAELDSVPCERLSLDNVKLFQRKAVAAIDNWYIPISAPPHTWQSRLFSEQDIKEARDESSKLFEKGLEQAKMSLSQKPMQNQ